MLGNSTSQAGSLAHHLTFFGKATRGSVRVDRSRRIVLKWPTARFLTRAGGTLGSTVGTSCSLPATRSRSAHAKYAGASVAIVGRHPRKRDQFGWWRSHLPTSGGHEGTHANC